MMGQKLFANHSGRPGTIQVRWARKEMAAVGVQESERAGAGTSRPRPVKAVPLHLRASGGEGVNCRLLPTRNFVPRPGRRPGLFLHGQFSEMCQNRVLAIMT